MNAAILRNFAYVYLLVRRNFFVSGILSRNYCTSIFSDAHLSQVFMLSVFQLSQYFLTKECDFDLEGGGMCGGRVGLMLLVFLHFD